MKWGFVLLFVSLFHAARSQCSSGESSTYSRWTGVRPDGASPVFVYSASGEEPSLTGACLARCRDIPECRGVAVGFGTGSCYGVAAGTPTSLRADNDVSYFEKICLEVPQECQSRWWSVDVTPGYQLHADTSSLMVLTNVTAARCFQALLDTTNSEQLYRSAQWVVQEPPPGTDVINSSPSSLGTCVLNVENKYTEPESFRVANYRTIYVENQCRHDYSKKIDRCSYEEYYNQTLRHIDYTAPNSTKEQCKKLCEEMAEFVCRGFSWSPSQGRAGGAGGAGAGGLCDLHSDDLVTSGSWLLRKTSLATYYRRVICLNISVECTDSTLVVRYRPRGVFRGRVYVSGRREGCGAAGRGAGEVQLRLPLTGDCDVHYARAVSYGPTGLINRTMAYVTLMIQNNPIIQTAGDRWVRVGCSPDHTTAAQVDATIAVHDLGRPSVVGESLEWGGAGSAAAAGGSAPVTLYVVRPDLAQDPQPAAVSLGDLLELRIDTSDENEIEAYHLVASSRLGDSSVLLLDSRGCPTGQVDFPLMARSFPEPGTQRLSARFRAFRFPTSHVVRFGLMVRFCQHTCPQPNCDGRREARGSNWTTEWSEEDTIGMSGTNGTSGVRAVPLQLEVVVGADRETTADTLLTADHHASIVEAGVSGASGEAGLVCVHEVVLVAAAVVWLVVQILLLLAGCLLLKRYRRLAEMSLQKDYQSFDNVGFDTVSTHRRVHWPDDLLAR